MHHIFKLTQVDNSKALVLNDTMIFIKDDNLELNLTGSSNDAVSVFGKRDSVFLDVGTHDIKIQDHGSGTFITMRGLPTNLTISDFQHDHTGSVHIGDTATTPVLKPDGHGGTLVTFGSRGPSIDFVGDKHVVASGGPGNLNFSG